jgi:DNA-binding MarR family transcriptional regulator
MEQQSAPNGHISTIENILRHITWQGHKHSLQTLNRPDVALTLPQMMTLFAIHEAGTCRMSELADVTQQSAGTLTGIVDRLIEDGLVARVRDADDRRVVQVVLTPEGEARVQHVLQMRYAEMEKVLNHFSPQQLVQFEDLLRLLLRGIDEASVRAPGAPPELPPLS